MAGISYVEQRINQTMLAFETSRFMYVDPRASDVMLHTIGEWRWRWSETITAIKTRARMTQKAEILVCKCSSAEHQVVYWHDQADNEVYMHIHLAPLPWWKRLVAAVKYLFGHKSRYGNWDEFVLNKDHATQLRDLADRIEECERERLKRHAEEW